jgi:hypothetical protein
MDCALQDAGFRLMDARYWMLGARCKVRRSIEHSAQRRGFEVGRSRY